MQKKLWNQNSLCPKCLLRVLKFHAAVYEVRFNTIKLFNSEYSILYMANSKFKRAAILGEYMKSEFAGNMHTYTLSYMLIKLNEIPCGGLRGVALTI